MRILLALLCVGFVASTQAADWLTNYNQALSLAQETKAPILVDFTGSDWCVWCQKLDAEVFDTAEFTAYADKNLILLKLDFPRYIPQSRELMAQNRDLASKYKVEGFPTILLLTPQGEVIATTGYKRGGADVYIKHLKTLLKK